MTALRPAARPCSLITLQRKGGVEEHATLLCSLLLGCGLDAYVCIGTQRVESAPVPVPHAWVLTISPSAAITFWEPLTGQRCAHTT